MKKLIIKYQEIIKYLVFGGLTTLVSLTTYYTLVSTILDAHNPIELQISNIISWIISVTFAYITNKKFVFEKTEKRLSMEIIEFYTSRVTSLIIEMILMFILVTKLHFDDKTIKLVVQILVIIVNYLLSKLIVFKKEK